MCAVAEVLRALVAALKDVLKVPVLSDTIVFQGYAQAALVVDEVVKEVRGQGGGAGAGAGGRVLPAGRAAD